MILAGFATLRVDDRGRAGMKVSLSRRRPRCSWRRNAAAAARCREYYGTVEPFASEAVYFVLTDRFVNGDPGNDQPRPGRRTPHLRPAAHGPNGVADNIGYLGGDFSGILDNADYIREMGFTRGVDHADRRESRRGVHRRSPDRRASSPTRARPVTTATGASTSIEVDEHLDRRDSISPTSRDGMREEHGLEVVLDIVCEPRLAVATRCRWTSRCTARSTTRTAASSPTTRTCRRNSSTRRNPLHAFSPRARPRGALRLQRHNPAVMDYLARRIPQWIDQGVAAFRIDTIRHVPHAVLEGLRRSHSREHPGFFMFGEASTTTPEEIADAHPAGERRRQRARLPDEAGDGRGVREAGATYARLLEALHLEDGVYRESRTSS